MSVMLSSGGVQAQLQDETLRFATATIAPAFGRPEQGTASPSVYTLWPMYDSLTRVSPQGDVSGLLASGWKNLDPTTWELTLKRGVKFHNGKEFTAKQVAGQFGYLTTNDEAAGTVAYVRTGCPESSRFGHNDALRECGSGWGNHVIVDHGGGLFTRYAHLAADDVDVVVGDAVQAGQRLAGMGNSGRSEDRHMHLEVGSATEPFDPCAPARSFDVVHDPAPLGVAPTSP